MKKDEKTIQIILVWYWDFQKENSKSRNKKQKVNIKTSQVRK